MMQKIGLVDDIDFWLQARLLRNSIAHTYQANELKELYNEFKKQSNEIVKTIDKIEEFLTKQGKGLFSL